MPSPLVDNAQALFEQFSQARAAQALAQQILQARADQGQGQPHFEPQMQFGDSGQFMPGSTNPDWGGGAAPSLPAAWQDPGANNGNLLAYLFNGQAGAMNAGTLPAVNPLLGALGDPGMSMQGQQMESQAQQGLQPDPYEVNRPPDVSQFAPGSTAVAAQRPTPSTIPQNAPGMDQATQAAQPAYAQGLPPLGPHAPSALTTNPPPSPTLGSSALARLAGSGLPYQQQFQDALTAHFGEGPMPQFQGAWQLHQQDQFAQNPMLGLVQQLMAGMGGGQGPIQQQDLPGNSGVASPPQGFEDQMRQLATSHGITDPAQIDAFVKGRQARWQAIQALHPGPAPSAGTDAMMASMVNPTLGHILDAQSRQAQADYDRKAGVYEKALADFHNESSHEAATMSQLGFNQAERGSKLAGAFDTKVDKWAQGRFGGENQWINQATPGLKEAGWLLTQGTGELPPTIDGMPVEQAKAKYAKQYPHMNLLMDQFAALKGAKTPQDAAAVLFGSEQRLKELASLNDTELKALVDAVAYGDPERFLWGAVHNHPAEFFGWDSYRKPIEAIAKKLGHGPVWTQEQQGWSHAGELPRGLNYEQP